MVTFQATVIGEEVHNEDKKEISEIQWVDINTTNELMPYHKKAVEELMKSFSTYNFQVSAN